MKKAEENVRTGKNQRPGRKIPGRPVPLRGGAPTVLGGAAVQGLLSSPLLTLSPPAPALFAQPCSPQGGTMQSCPPLPPAQQKRGGPVRPSVPFRGLLEAELCLPGTVLPVDSVKTRS